MTPLLHLGHADLIERELYSMALQTFKGLPARLELPTRHFVAFVASDATSVDISALEEFSRSLLASGCIYFCAWGPNCEKVHDGFDDVCNPDTPVVMTTWHAGESLDEALWFFVCDTHPADDYSSTCGAGIAISIGHSDWAEHIRARLSNIGELKRIVLDDV